LLSSAQENLLQNSTQQFTVPHAIMEFSAFEDIMFIKQSGQQLLEKSFPVRESPPMLMTGTLWLL